MGNDAMPSAASLDDYLINRASGPMAEDAEYATLSLAETHSLARQFGCTCQDVELAALRHHVLPGRYHRNLGTVGWEGQIRLLQSSVAVVGAGGLGGWIIEGLARMGVGHLVIIDGDRFQENNLNRQIGCTELSLGKAKAECLAARVADVNSAVHVSAHVSWLTEDNAVDLLRGSQVVVDALDTLPSRFLLERAAQQLDIPMVHGAIGGYMGQVMTIFPGDPGLRAFYGTPTFERGVETRLGNPAATPMMISAWQIQEVIKILIQQGEPIRNRTLIMDAEHGDVTEIQLR